MKVVELFAGVGGFRVGLEAVENSPFEVVWANQWEPATKAQPAFDCYIKNFGERGGVHSNQDIATVNAIDIPDHDLLVGGFPCQDYSVARTKSGEQGIQGKKGVLFWEIERILREKRPSYVLLENVDRLLKAPSKQRGRDFAVMLASFRDLGYYVEWRVINAAEYGHAQRRRRVFIFAYHRDTVYGKQMLQYLQDKEQIIHNVGFFSDIFPIHEKSSDRHLPTMDTLPVDIVELSDTYSTQFRNSGIMMEGIFYSEESIPVEQKPVLLGEILESNVNEKYYLDMEKETGSGRTVYEQFKYLKGSKKIERLAANGHPYIYSEGGMAFPDPLDRPGRTMLTSEGTTNRSTHVVEDPETKRLRLLTPVECERLNDFPDNWTSLLTDRQRYFMMGNALVTGLVTKMGEKLKTIGVEKVEVQLDIFDI